MGGGERMTARERAEAQQRAASDPAVSSFVAASAGSGKTKLLTDRVVRLLLAGADPARVQCLTFTKAAAAEMALRLQRRLGAWAVADDGDLADQLRALHVDPSQDVLARARALFARVLDLPGGMRIGTIHAFCQSLLRRFPLEAAISPHFALMDDSDAADAMHEARESMLQTRGDDDADIDHIAGLCDLKQFGALIQELQRAGDKLPRALRLRDGLPAAQRRALGVTATDPAQIIAEAMYWQEERLLRAAAQSVVARASKACQERAAAILDWLAHDAATRHAHWDAWCTLFLKADGDPRAARSFVNEKLQQQEPALVGPFLQEAERIAQVQDCCAAIPVAEASVALLRLAEPVLRGYADRKAKVGQLDYDDLIARTIELLHDPGAAWVLYKLDGGLDHLLLDEVQDTSPAQWAIAHALTQEFFAGAGARDVDRTVFAVGDRKQSIYSFQGADASFFDENRRALQARVEDAGKRFLPVTLDVSFRSTAPVLALVDSVFADPEAAAGVVAPGEMLSHYADRAGYAGSVMVWEKEPAPDAEQPAPWAVPTRNAVQDSAPEALARKLAGWIDEKTRGMWLASRGRPLAPGDVLVLLRKRSDFARSLVRELKARNVPVAGLDRVTLTEQPAVEDLLALCDTLLLPQDDLTLACVLRSPLGGLSDDSLYDLAADRADPDRRGSLWEALRARHAERPEWQAAWMFTSALLARVDYATPHALLTEALGALGGRAKLLRRLGPEAREAIDELLAQALAFQRAHPPSLQAFVHWVRQTAAEVKREPEGHGQDGAGVVRIMTVHGAKGLQAPLVILPDTTAGTRDDAKLWWARDRVTGVDVPLFSPRKEVRCNAVHDLIGAHKANRAEEENRLLYVALTRAEDHLLVCGWETRRGPAWKWYDLISRGFDRLRGDPPEPCHWTDDRTLASDQGTAPEQRAASTADQPGALPSWAGAAPDWTPRLLPPEPPMPARLAPSRPADAALGPVPQAASPLAERQPVGERFRRGTLTHALLQHLPDLPALERADAARSWLARPGHEADGLADEVMAILAHPDLAPLFGPGSRAEVPLTGVIGGQVIGGLVDRLAVLPDRVLIADYKTNREPPRGPDATPVLYLRQLAAYRAVLRAIHPDRPITCVLVWTRAARADVIPDALLDTHAPGVSVSAQACA